jgi:hypothetical protein
LKVAGNRSSLIGIILPILIILLVIIEIDLILLIVVDGEAVTDMMMALM